MRPLRANVVRIGLALCVAGATTWMASCSLTTSLDGLTGGATTDGAPVTSGDEGGKPDVAAPLDGAIDAGGDAPGLDASGIDASDAAATISATYRAAVLADSPVGYWRLDESVGAGDAKDESGHAHDGIYAGGVTLGVAGAIAGNTAAHFDGTTANIAFGDLFRFDTTKPFSVEAWVKPEMNGPGEYGAILARSLDPDGWGLYVDPGLDVSFERENATNDDIIIGPVLATTAFRHLVATYDGSSVRLYYDSVLVQGPTASGSIVGTASNFFVGAVANASGGFFKGVLDEPAVYDHALTVTQIHAHYEAAKAP